MNHYVYPSVNNGCYSMLGISTVLFVQGMSFSPNKHDFECGMEGVVGRLEETLLCIKPLVMDPVFYPFTRPVLYGKQEDLPFKVQGYRSR